ncbi:hypothetical protein BX600DRAFT_530781 [Xylariales sp. PMI_506]|nr:hypothetical protein BX600DRAFT_530781 [Xylariales sp. PMI_506]
MGVSSATGSGYESFHLYRHLPTELRREIWMHYLAEVTPMMYRFFPQYPARSSAIIQDHHHDDGRRPLQSEDTQVLRQQQPVADAIALLPFARRARGMMRSERLRSLAESTAPVRIATATCVEARQFAHELLPDTLVFSCPPEDGTGGPRRLSAGAHDSPGTAGSCPLYSLRFNGRQDIVVLQASWEEQCELADLAKSAAGDSSPSRNAVMPQSFARMRNVGITIGSLDRANNIRRGFRADPRECRCDTDDCSDSCRLESLPRFLAGCFPAVEAFFLAGIPGRVGSLLGGYYDHQHQRAKKEDIRLGSRNPCPCSTCRELAGAKRVWPAIKLADTGDEYVIYDERAKCAFPAFHVVEAIRQSWRPQFPYYKVLDHLDIRFIRQSES